MDSLIQFFSKIGGGFNSLSTARRFSLLIAGAVTLAMIAMMVYLTNQAEYRILFSNLSSDDASSILGKLQEKKIPYKLSPAGDAISVSAEKVSELRLELAAAGLPHGGGVGFEIFDNKSLGATDFEQQLNYRRALQGELVRTINSLDEIMQSRVHIALPKESLFVEEKKKPTASVTIKLKTGKTLRPSQIEGITHLVASSIEGMSANDVIVVDSRGNLLSNGQDESKLAKMTGSQIEYQRNIEKDLSMRIQSMLENIVGQGKAAAKVSADVDFKITEKLEETYDPEAQVIRSMQRQTEKSSGALAAKAAQSAAAGSPEREKVDEVINFEINKVTNKTIMPTGEIRKLSIAVLVDGIYTKNDKGAEVYQPRDKKELDTLEDLVRKSAGFNAGRGDQVVVSSMPFNNGQFDGALEGKSWQDSLAPFLPLIRYGFVFLLGAAVFFFVVRPLIKSLTMLERPGRTEMQSAPSLAYGIRGEKPPLAIGGLEGNPLNDAEIARQLASADSKKFAEILRNWLK
jgi:flagellar M-ring protein FliF